MCAGFTEHLMQKWHAPITETGENIFFPKVFCHYWRFEPRIHRWNSSSADKFAMYWPYPQCKDTLRKYPDLKAISCVPFLSQHPIRSAKGERVSEALLGSVLLCSVTPADPNLISFCLSFPAQRLTNHMMRTGLKLEQLQRPHKQYRSLIKNVMLNYLLFPQNKEIPSGDLSSFICCFPTFTGLLEPPPDLFSSFTYQYHRTEEVKGRAQHLVHVGLAKLAVFSFSLLSHNFFAFLTLMLEQWGKGNISKSAMSRAALEHSQLLKLPVSLLMQHIILILLVLWYFKLKTYI